MHAGGFQIVLADRGEGQVAFLHDGDRRSVRRMNGMIDAPVDRYRLDVRDGIDAVNAQIAQRRCLTDEQGWCLRMKREIDQKTNRFIVRQRI